MGRATGVTDHAKDAILLALQEFFSSQKNTQGTNLLFNRELSQSKVLIADKYTTNLEEVEKKPAIIVMRGAQSWTRRGIGQHEGFSGPAVADKFKDMINGSFSCLCMSRQGLEAEEMAHMVFILFQGFRRKIIKELGIHDIQSVILGEEMVAQTDSKKEIAVVPVTIGLLVTWGWTLEQEGPVLQEVNANIRLKNAETVTRLVKKAVTIGV